MVCICENKGGVKKPIPTLLSSATLTQTWSFITCSYGCVTLKKLLRVRVFQGCMHFSNCARRIPKKNMSKTQKYFPINSSKCLLSRREIPCRCRNASVTLETSSETSQRGLRCLQQRYDCLETKDDKSPEM